MAHRPDPPLPGVSPPVQERSRATYERILAAAEARLREVEFGSLNIEEVLRDAGVSTGSFYARFADKHALLTALVDRYARDLHELARREAPPAGGPRTLEGCAREEVRHRVRRFRRRGGLIRTAVLESRRHPELAAELARLTRAVNARIVERFRPCFAEIGHEDPERAVIRGAYFVGAVCRDRILFPRGPHAASVALPLAALEDELTLLLRNYLRN